MEYSLLPLVHNGYVYIKLCKGMYGFPHIQFPKGMPCHSGFPSIPPPPGFWHHTYCPVMFMLEVDNFGVQYIGIDNAMHLINASKQHYMI